MADNVPIAKSVEFTRDEMNDWTGNDHAAEAMEWLARVEQQQSDHGRELCLKKAQIHATLAMAAAIRDR